MTGGNRRKAVKAIFGLGICLLLAGCIQAPEACRAAETALPPGVKVKNVILLIGDGMGFNHVRAANLFQGGQMATQVYERFPVRLAMSTFAQGGGYEPKAAWTDFAYVKNGATDSAAAATAMAAGVKTSNGAIGGLRNEEGNFVSVPTVLERAETLGKATGVVTSVQLSHATPAAFVAHNESRHNYEAIAREMILESAVDLLMGAGHPFFDDNGEPVAAVGTFKYVGGGETWKRLLDGTAGGDADGDGTADPWLLIQTRKSFRSLAQGPAPGRVLGIAPVCSTLQQKRKGDPFAPPHAFPANASAPTLAEMTRAALNVLDDDPDGFFLMVEGGAIDWAGHANQSGRLIEEQLDFNQAVEAVVEWVGRESNWEETLVIVTGDHETGYLAGPGSDPGWEPLVDFGAGKLPGLEWHSNGHTNQLIPLYAKGDAALLLRRFAGRSDPVRGPYVDNTDLARLMFAVMR